MFEVGERVVCVDDRPRGGKVGDDRICARLRRGRIYTVKRVKYFEKVGPYTVRTGAIIVAEIDTGSTGFYADRFRKLRNLDTSQSLQALIDLPNKVKNGELVS